MRFLPIYIDTRQQKILIVGGGVAAEAKLRTLIKTDAKLHVVAKIVSSEILRWADELENLYVETRSFRPEDMDGAVLIYAATDDSSLNSELAALATQKNIPVNASDQKQDCSFYSPAIVDRDPIVVAIGTEGTAPGLSRSIKADLEKRLPKTLGSLARKTGKLRARLSLLMPSFSERQRFWASIFYQNQDLSDRLKLSAEALDIEFEKQLNETTLSKKEQGFKPMGHVALVGAGPGNLDLLTIGAQRRLHSADVIIYDRLVSQDVLDLGRKEAKYIYVGKTPGQSVNRQEEINHIMVEEAMKGHDVVRLKGGDPLVFGRADEEVDALEQAGIAYEIIPGITSAAAAAASIGMSLTRRGHNKSVALVAGHDCKGFAEQDWKSLAVDNARAAIYMGLGASRFIQGRLLLHGAHPSRPVTIVENASRSNEKIVNSNLNNMVQDIEKYEVLGPAVLLLGYKSRHTTTPALSELRAIL